MSEALVDLGRSHVRVVSATSTPAATAGRGSATPAPAAAAALVAPAVRPACPDLAGARLAVGAPGVVTAPELAGRVRRTRCVRRCRWPEVLVVSDSAAWQAGAFGGGDGAVVAVGTGAVSVARHGGAGPAPGRARAAARRRRRRRLDRPASAAPRRPRDRQPAARGRRRAFRRVRALARPARAAATSRRGWPPSPRTSSPSPTAATPARGTVLDAAADGLAAPSTRLPADAAACLVGGLAPALDGRLRAASAAHVGGGGRRRGRRPARPARRRRAVRRRGGAAGRAEGRRRHDPAARHRHPADRAGAPTAPPTSTPGPPHDWSPGSPRATTPPCRPCSPPPRRWPRRPTSWPPRSPTTAGWSMSGPGTPGRLAVQDAAELVPTFGLDPGRAVVLLAGGDAGRRAGGRERGGRRRPPGPATSTASRSAPATSSSASPRPGAPPTCAPRWRGPANSARPPSASATCPAAALGREADLAVDLATGPEVIAGSTRLAAGTAQKIALNTLSTAALDPGSARRSGRSWSTCWPPTTSCAGARSGSCATPRGCPTTRRHRPARGGRVGAGGARRACSPGVDPATAARPPGRARLGARRRRGGSRVRVLGMLSGTSADGLDVAVADLSHADGVVTLRPLHASTVPLPGELRARRARRAAAGRHARPRRCAGWTPTSAGSAARRPRRWPPSTAPS